MARCVERAIPTCSGSARCCRCRTCQESSRCCRACCGCSWRGHFPIPPGGVPGVAEPGRAAPASSSRPIADRARRRCRSMSGAVDEVRERIGEAWLVVVEEPVDQPWYRCEMVFGLPEGHRVRVSGPAPPSELVRLRAQRRLTPSISETRSMAVRRMGVEEELLLVDPGQRCGAVGLAGCPRGASRPGGEAGEGDDKFGRRGRHGRGAVPATDRDRYDALPDRRRAGRRPGQVPAGSRRFGSAEAGAALVAVGTPVLDEDDGQVTQKPRYERIVDEFGEIGRQGSVCGMHVHVDVADDGEGIRVIDGLRPWLPVLRAMSVNSPYCHGRDTGYASWRSQVWGRWPSAGPTEAFGDPAALSRGHGGTDRERRGYRRRHAVFRRQAVRALSDRGDPGVRHDDRAGRRRTAGDPDSSARHHTRGGFVAGRFAGGLGGTRCFARRIGRLRDGLSRTCWIHETRLAAARAVVESLIEHVRPALEDTDDVAVVGAARAAPGEGDRGESTTRGVRARWPVRGGHRPSGPVRALPDLIWYACQDPTPRWS